LTPRQTRITFAGVSLGERPPLISKLLRCDLHGNRLVRSPISSLAQAQAQGTKKLKHTPHIHSHGFNCGLTLSARGQELDVEARLASDGEVTLLAGVSDAIRIPICVRNVLLKARVRPLFSRILIYPIRLVSSIDSSSFRYERSSFSPMRLRACLSRS
jgi:hypothetical protein